MPDPTAEDRARVEAGLRVIWPKTRLTHALINAVSQLIADARQAERTWMLDMTRQRFSASRAVLKTDFVIGYEAALDNIAAAIRARSDAAQGEERGP